MRLTAALLILFVPAVSFAMGEIPSTPEVVTGVEFVREIGFPGSGVGQFYYPNDVCVSVFGDISTGLGNLFVADTGNQRIERMDDDGDFVYQFGQFGTDDGKFNDPSGVVVDFNNTIYVVDQENARVQKFDIRGNFEATFGSFGAGNGQFNRPRGITMDHLGYVYVADSGNDRIQKFTDSGQFVSSFGGFGVGEGFFDGPEDVAVDSSRSMLIADTENNRIQVIDEFGRPIFSFGGDSVFDTPKGVAVDSQRIYVSDSGNDRIKVFDRNGNFIIAFGKRGSGMGEFSNPTGISIGRAGHIFVADTDNHRIQEFRLLTE